MVRTLVLLSNYEIYPTELSALRSATLAAYISAQLPQLRVHSRLVTQQAARGFRLPYALSGESPDIIGFHVDDLWDPNLGMLLERLKPTLPQCLFFAMGPGAANSERAARLLHRFPQVDFVIRGNPEETLLRLAHHWMGEVSLPTPLPPGLTLWQGDDLIETGPAPQTLNLHALPSPYLSGYLDVGRETPCRLEIGRLDGEGVFHPFPMARIQKDLRHLLGQLEVPKVILEPDPCDGDPFFFKRVLKEIERYNRRSCIQVGLNGPPASPLLDAMGSAGVGILRLNGHHLPGQDMHLADKAPRLRSHVKRLQDHGFQTQIHVEVGHPDQIASDMEGLINRIFSAGVDALDIQPARMAATENSNPALLLSDGNRREVLAHAGMPFEAAGSILVRGQCLAAYLPPFSGTLRALLRLLHKRPMDLANDLRILNLPGDESQAQPIGQRHTELTQFVDYILKENGRGDRRPVFTALLKLERWIAETPRPFTREIAHPYEPNAFHLVIPTISRAVRVKSFAYDVLALVRGSTIEDVPVRKSHVLVWNGGHGAKKIYQLNDLQRAALTLVDGIRPIEQLVHLLGEQYAQQDFDEVALVGVFEHLIAMGALIPAGTTQSPPKGRQNSNILLFKRRSK